MHTIAMAAGGARGVKQEKLESGIRRQNYISSATGYLRGLWTVTKDGAVDLFQTTNPNLFWSIQQNSHLFNQPLTTNTITVLKDFHPV